MHKFSEVKITHKELLSEYMRILNTVSKISFFVSRYELDREMVQGIKPEGMSRLLTWFARLLYGIERLTTLRFLVGLFVESHIKRRLEELSAAYIQMAHTLAASKKQNPRYTKWLDESSDELLKLAGTLASWQSFKGVIAIIWPLGVGLILARMNLKDVYELIWQLQPLPLETVLKVMALPIAYVFIFIYSAHNFKRFLFMPGSGFLIKMFYSNTNDFVNVYKVEDKLFGLVERRKHREFSVDLIAFSIACLLLGSRPLWDQSFGRNNASDFDWLSLSLLITSLFFGLGAIRRRWR